MVDIQLQFRTTELNGVLLSVPEKRGSASLSLSIDDGSVTQLFDRIHLMECNVTGFSLKDGLRSGYGPQRYVRRAPNDGVTVPAV